MVRFFLTLVFFIGLFITSPAVQAQSKLTDTKQSSVTGLALPEGTKQDKRSLSVASAKMLLEMVGEKAGVTLKNTEVLYLPPPSENQFTVETLKTKVQEAGWNINPVINEPDYYWLNKQGRYVLAYFKASKKTSDLYLADDSQSPVLSKAPTTPKETVTQPGTTQQHNPIPPTAVGNGHYAFTTTHFDDGWNSTVREEWVEVTKGNIKVLLHYPKEGTIIPADPEPHVNNAWNILVAPRYSNLSQYRTAYINTYNRPYLGMGTVNENSSGKSLYVVLFRQGQTGWIECIAPDKNAFVQQFRFDPEAIRWDSETELLNSLSAMVNYNKFAIAAADFNGTWTSDFNGMQQLYHVYTGNYAGMNINQSRETFEFDNNGRYHWKLLVVNGMVGSMNYAQVQSNGQLQVLNNWQVSCTDIEGKPKKYHAFFSCIKGARLLHLLDADFPGNGVSTVFGRK